MSEEGWSLNHGSKPKCWSCQWYCVKHCIAGQKGYPDIGVVCNGYTYEPGSDEYEG